LKGGLSPHYIYGQAGLTKIESWLKGGGQEREMVRQTMGKE